MSDTARDPFVGLRDCIRDLNPIPAFAVPGRVLSAAPLRVRAEGLDLDAEDLRVSRDLTGAYADELATELGLALPGPFLRLEEGDDVLLIPSMDRQIYYLIAKL